VAAEIKAASERLAAHPPDYAYYLENAPDVLEVEEAEEEEEVPGFYDLPDSTRDSWRFKAISMLRDSEGLSPRLQASHAVVDSSQGAIGSCDEGSKSQQFEVDPI
jgi:hypothetical protein